MIEGEPWFVASDVCVNLFEPDRVKAAGVTQYMRHIDTTERRLVPKNTLSQFQGNRRGSGGVVTLISESGLYKLVMRSDKPDAKVATGDMGEDGKRTVEVARLNRSPHLPHTPESFGQAALSSRSSVRIT